MYGLPIRGPLHPNDWVRPPGNQDFRVTQDAKQHTIASPGHPAGPMALDIGDGNPDADDLIAVHAGKVAQADKQFVRPDGTLYGSANLSIDWTEGSTRWKVVYAHNLLPHPVKVGQSIALGQLVGRIGKTGASAAHLHIQIGYLSGSTWVWLDPWPLITNEGDMLQGSNPFRVVNRKVSVISDGSRFRASPATGSTPILAKYDSGAEVYPDFAVDGQAVNGSPRWYAFWGDTAKGKQFGYMPETLLTPLAPIEDSDCTDEVAAAVAPLNAKISTASAALA